MSIFCRTHIAVGHRIQGGRPGPLRLPSAADLAHHQGQTAFAPLLKSNLKAKALTHIALVNEITIPPMHFPSDAPLSRSHHLPCLYFASVRRRRNGSVSVGRIFRSCWRDSAISLVIYYLLHEYITSHFQHISSNLKNYGSFVNSFEFVSNLDQPGPCSFIRLEMAAI